LTQNRIGFDDPGDVREILLPFAAAARLIHRCPNLSLQDVLDASDRKVEIQHRTHRCTADEIGIPRIELNLDPDIGFRVRDVEAVRKPST